MNLRVVSLCLPNGTINIPNFWYGCYFYGLLRVNHTLHGRRWPKIGPTWSKFGYVWPKLAILKIIPYFSRYAINFPNSWYADCLFTWKPTSYNSLVGFSTLAVECGFPSVRSSVRGGISRKPRIRFWWFFAQSYILMSLKKIEEKGFYDKWWKLGICWCYCLNV